MRNNVKVAPALSPLSAIYSAITDTLIHIPFHGGGGAAINFAASLAVVKGYPTKVTLGSTPSPAPLCGSKVKVSGVTPTGYNGYWKVVYSNGADVYLDLDSSALGDWASGGTMSFNVLYERLGNLAAQDLSGTVTGLWADQTNGMVAHSAGTYTARIPTGISAFYLSAFSGFLVIGAKIKISSDTPSSEKFQFSIDRQSQTGAYSGSGMISARARWRGLTAAAMAAATTRSPIRLHSERPHSATWCSCSTCAAPAVQPAMPIWTACIRRLQIGRASCRER